MNFENYTTKATEAIQAMMDLATKKSHQDTDALAPALCSDSTKGRDRVQFAAKSREKSG